MVPQPTRDKGAAHEQRQRTKQGTRRSSQLSPDVGTSAVLRASFIQSRTRDTLRGSHARAVARRRARAARRLLPRVPRRLRGEHASRRKRDPGARSQASTTGLATPQRDGSAPREYVTDGKHRRVGKKVDGVLVKQWLYRDQLNPVAELDGAGDLVAQFVYGSRGHVPDFMVRGGVVYRIVSDQIGSVRLVVNADDVSDVLFRAEYTAFGEMTVLEGDVEAVPFGFAGGLFDAETGLVRFGARDYDPVVGRWTAKDPLRFRGSRMSLYSYSQNDPVNRFDPTGEVDDPVTSPYREYVDAFESAERLFPGGGPGGGSGGMGDAYRHCRASCKLAQKWGNAYSRVCGWLNEVAGGNDAGDRLMDDINNAIGRSYGVEGAGCSLACYSAAKRGVLVTFGQ